MRYDPNFHHRRSIRLPAWDYRERGAYFVTICTHNRECTMSDPSLAGAVLKTWQSIPDHFPSASVDEFIVMPNHVHGIVWLDGAAAVGARP
jgi:REP element-mobilizing transposase RayT